jgi:cardiolipin synthase
MDWTQAADIAVLIGTFLQRTLWIWDVIFAFIIVFLERKNPKAVWAWLLLMVVFPFVGFIFYLLAGQDFHKRRLFRDKEVQDRLEASSALKEHAVLEEGADPDPEILNFRDLVAYNVKTADALLTSNNDVDIYTDGNDKFNALIEDLKKAEKFINFQYYILRSDELFDRIKPVLKERAAAGVEVRVLYDAMGCRTTPRALWNELETAGIKTASFFPALFGRLQTRVNFRNHRKIVVIDNRVGYVGGYNVGREYVDMDPRFGHWRDTHLRIEGPAVVWLQARFMLDWNYAAKESLLENPVMSIQPHVGKRDCCEVQIISSGPDNQAQHIRDNYVRMIYNAQKSIYIQTPYFIPDESMLSALFVALNSGVEVNIMIPCKPDHPFVYWATYSYIGELIQQGAKCYTYDNGFLHAKGLVADEEVFCYGTTNMDIRSFALNFEVNAVVYDCRKAQEMAQAFRDDLKYCTEITPELYRTRTVPTRFKEQVCRLLSPIL